MVYTEIERLTKKQTASLRKELETIPSKIKALAADIIAEDSKSREAKLREESKALTGRQRQIYSEISRIETEAFQKALAVEYGVVGNPKFGKLYSIAYSIGHSSGNSEIEHYFSEMVELIK
jgi:hypothetical protein